jgi:hypothetical protein
MKVMFNMLAPLVIGKVGKHKWVKVFILSARMLPQLTEIT